MERKMDELGNHSPRNSSEIQTDKISNQNKKRKVLAEKAGDSPSSMHYCYSSGVVAGFDQESMPPSYIVEGQCEEYSGSESALDINSSGDTCFKSAEEGDVNVNELTKYEPSSASPRHHRGKGKRKHGSGNATCNCSSDNKITINNPAGGDSDQFHEVHEEEHMQLYEFEDCLRYMPIDDELEEYIYTTGIIPTSYYKSFGNLNDDEDFEARRLNTRPPTIDQEFQEFFSCLML